MPYTPQWVHFFEFHIHDGCYGNCPTAGALYRGVHVHERRKEHAPVLRWDHRVYVLLGGVKVTNIDLRIAIVGHKRFAKAHF